jgi:hypothetical protein
MWHEIYAFVELHGKFGLGLTIIVGLVVFAAILIFKPETADKIRGDAYLLLYKLSGKREHEKQYIVRNLRGSLNLARRDLHKHVSFLPRAVDVQWVSGEGGEVADIKEGEFIVKLDPSNEQKRNIVLMAEAVVRRTTLCGIRHSVGQALQDTIDGNMVRKLLGATKNKRVLDWYQANDFITLTNATVEHKKRAEEIAVMDERGIFTRMLLVELEDFSGAIANMPVRPYMAGEVDQVVYFFYQIAAKRYDEDVPLDFKKAHIDIGVVIAAKTDKILETIEPYVEAVRIHLQNGARAVYVLAFDKEWLGERNMNQHRRFQERIKELNRRIEKDLTCYKYFEEKYKCVDINGDQRNATCVRYVAPRIDG